MPTASGKYFFVSDVHLGASGDVQGRRERLFVDFLKSLPDDTAGLFLLGDIFDFWVEYRDVVPRGFTRVFGELARLSDAGCKIWFFKGNHDYWVTDYFSRELGITVVDEPYMVVELLGRRFCVGHGDFLNCSDPKARLIFKMFRNRALITALKALPTHSVFKFARWWSSKSRKSSCDYKFDVAGSDIESFAEDFGRREKIDYFIFGHFHAPSRTSLECGATLYLLDDWADFANSLYFSGNGICGLGRPNSQM